MLWLPGNQTCFRLVLFPSMRSHSAGRKAYRGSSSASAWKAFSTLSEICVLVNRHSSAEPRIPTTGAGGMPRVPTVSHTPRALMVISVAPSRYVSRVYPSCPEC